MKTKKKVNGLLFQNKVPDILRCTVKSVPYYLYPNEETTIHNEILRDLKALTRSRTPAIIKIFRQQARREEGGGIATGASAPPSSPPPK